MYQVREGYFGVVRGILPGLWQWKETDLKQLFKVGKKYSCHYRNCKEVQE